MMKSTLYITAAAFLLGACGGNTVKDVLGIDRRAPDEFRVVSRPPLSVPPQFDLRPPGVDGASTSESRDKAQSLVRGGDAAAPVNLKPAKNPGGSAADSMFLEKAGAANANPNVKQELAEKKINDQLEKEDRSWWEKISPGSDKKEPVVKAEGEAERLQKNKEEGKPVTEGETPETGGGTMSTLERWFGI